MYVKLFPVEKAMPRGIVLYVDLCIYGIDYKTLYFVTGSCHSNLPTKV